MSSKNNLYKTLGLVLSGGGARGAYEAGVIHYIRTMLPPKVRSRHFDVVCGASVGALNASFVAATAHDPKMQGENAFKLWENVREEDIYRRDGKALWDFVSKSSKGMVSNLLNKAGSGQHFNGFLDTAPFLPFIKKIISWNRISQNIREGFVRAVSLVATNVFTGRMELFIEKAPDVEYTGEYITHFGKIDPIHAMASAAIPIVFPSVMVDGIAYTDGGLRLNTPMSPAIQLGADSVLVIGLHYRPPNNEVTFHGEIGKAPPLGQILGRVMNSIFLDRINYDLEQLERINRIIDWAEMLHGKTFVEDLNEMLVQKKIRGDIANRGLKRITALRIRPSQDIGEIFSECFQKNNQRHFSAFEKLLVRFLDIDPTKGIDFLSYIVFMPEYLKRLLELGFEDARTNHDKLVNYFEGGKSI
ncbi:MAG: patatin-like phospholipase family protein [Deltaproteobacteria bacterium]|nr:MAG: patatin-like phospholipase family protein [Deltaproteobacteria bacterium]